MRNYSSSATGGTPDPPSITTCVRRMSHIPSYLLADSEKQSAHPVTHNIACNYQELMRDPFGATHLALTVQVEAGITKVPRSHA